MALPVSRPLFEITFDCEVIHPFGAEVGDLLASVVVKRRHPFLVGLVTRFD